MTARPAGDDDPGGARTIWDMDLPLTQVQKDLAYRLSAYSDAAADSYGGALCIFHGVPYPDRASHLAYALRDVVDHLARRGQDRRERTLPLRRDERKALLIRTFDPLTKQSYEYDGYYQTLVDAYAELSGIAHRRDPASRNDPLEVMPRIEEALHMLSTPQAATNNGVDEIMSRDPTIDGAKEMIRMISTGATQSRILTNLPTRWLSYMAEAGFFRDPKEGEHWAAHRYLLRCVEDDPSTVADIIARYDPGAIRSAPALYGDFLDCASRMPASHAAKVSRFMMKNRLGNLFVHYPDKYLKVAAKLYISGESDLAVELVRKGLTLDNIHYDKYPGPDWLNMPLREFASATVGKDPLPLFELLADLLEMIIMERVNDDGKISDTDSSLRIKRPTIEESDQNLSRLDSSMIDHMRNCLSIMDSSQLLQAMNITGKKHPLIYRRLEMFTYDAFPDLFHKEMEKYAIQYLGNYHVYHEHYNMLRNNYCAMSDSTKKTISEAISKKTSADEYPAVHKGGTKVGITRDEFRQLQYFECIKECLDDNQSSIYSMLVEKYGELPHPGYAYYRQSGRIKPEDGPGPLEGKDAGQVIDTVKEHKAEPDVFHDKTLRGFSYLAGNSPEEYSKHATDLIGSDPNTIERFLHVMAGSLKGGKSIDWGSTTKLLKHVGDAHSKGRYGQSEETALAACSMLEDAFQHAPPGFEFRDVLKGVILGFVKASTPDRDYHLGSFEAAIRSDDDDIDSINMSINNLEGRSFLVMMMYALWCYDNTKSRELVPEVRDILDEYVGGAHTVSRTAVLGSYLPGLYFFDKEWTLHMAEKIRTGIPAKIAFWDGFVRWNYLDRGVFSDLQYIYREFLTGSMSKILKNRETFKSSFDHSLSAYLYGYEDSEDTFDRFLRSIEDKPTKKLVEHCVFQVGVVVRGIQDLANFDTDRLARIWRNRAFEDQDLTGWLVGSKAGRETSIKLYSEHVSKHPGTPSMPYHLLEDLESYADEFPEEVAASLCRLAENPLNFHQAKSVNGIIEILKRHRDRIGDKLEKITELVMRNTY